MVQAVQLAVQVVQMVVQMPKLWCTGTHWYTWYCTVHLVLYYVYRLYFTIKKCCYVKSGTLWYRWYRWYRWYSLTVTLNITLNLRYVILRITATPRLPRGG